MRACNHTSRSQGPSQYASSAIKLGHIAEHYVDTYRVWSGQ